MKRVVVTGIGLLTSLGDSVNKSWNNLLSCKSGIKKISSFDTTDLKCKIAGYISNDPNVENFFDDNKFLEKKDINRNDRFIQYGLAAAQQAVEDANIYSLKQFKLKYLHIYIITNNLTLKFN